MMLRVLKISVFFLAAFAALACLAAWRASSANAGHDEDLAELEGLVTARGELEDSVLESRAGLRQNFDRINDALRGLRATPRLARALRDRDRDYATAADILDRQASALGGEEVSIERFKTDLALLRLASRYFPLAADALSYPDNASAPAGAQDAATDAGTDAGIVPGERLVPTVASLRTDVERFQVAPRRDVADRIARQLEELEELGPELDSQRQSDLAALIGHTRAILDHRERVDSVVRTLMASGDRADFRAAREELERVARHDSAMEVALRIAAAELLGLLLLLVATISWRTRWR
jgi:hypothetical protein